jgi:hypothetical protein
MKDSWQAGLQKITVLEIFVLSSLKLELILKIHDQNRIFLTNIAVDDITRPLKRYGTQVHGCILSSGQMVPLKIVLLLLYKAKPWNFAIYISISLVFSYWTASFMNNFHFTQTSKCSMFTFTQENLKHLEIL